MFYTFIYTFLHQILLQCFSFGHFDNWRTIDEQGLCFMFINTYLYHTVLKVNQGTVVEHLFMNKVFILYLHTHTLLYQTVLTTEQLLMDKVYVLYVYIYLLTSNIVDTYKGNVVEQGLCFMCLLQYFSLKHFDN